MAIIDINYPQMAQKKRKAEGREHGAHGQGDDTKCQQGSLGERSPHVLYTGPPLTENYSSK